MLTARLENGNSCNAWETEKGLGPFFCKACHHELILKKGPIVQHHFAHKQKGNCEHGKGEGELHHLVKREIYTSLVNSKKLQLVELEYNLGDIVPDIFVINNDNAIAIEIQKSQISVEKVISKCLNYYSRNICVIWVIPSIDLLGIYERDDKDVCNIKAWSNLFNQLYFGRLYIWDSEHYIKAIHLEKFNVFVDFKDYYNEFGEQETAGGYEKALKRTKAVNVLDQKLDIIDDFCCSTRKEFDTRKYKLPKCHLWMDRLDKWW